MHSNCILDSVANLLVRLMVFVENVQKSPIKGLDAKYTRDKQFFTLETYFSLIPNG